MDSQIMKNYIQQKQSEIESSQNNFYTASGIHIYIKEPVDNINISKVINKVEERVPDHI